MSIADDMLELHRLVASHDELNVKVLNMFISEEMTGLPVDTCTSLPEMFQAIGEYYIAYEDDILDQARGSDPANGYDRRDLREQIWGGGDE